MQVLAKLAQSIYIDVCMKCTSRTHLVHANYVITPAHLLTTLTPARGKRSLKGLVYAYCIFQSCLLVFNLSEGFCYRELFKTWYNRNNCGDICKIY